MNSSRIFLSFAVAVSAALEPAVSVAGPVTDEQRALVQAAVPDTAPAKPAKPRRLLVYTQTKGFRHQSIEVGVEAVTLMGERTGAYTVTVTAEPDVFTAESLKEYDGILFLNVTGSIFDRVETQQALLDFVRNGGGVMGIHSATDSCYEWPEWGAMFGGWFDGHPWNANTNVTLWIEEPAHTLNKPFGGAESYAIQDEIYQLKGPDFRSSHRVLVSLDTRRTDMALPGIKRTDGDFPITMIREYGRGRVFYCSLGHNHHIYWNRTILNHNLAGFQWAMGDLDAIAAPRPRGPMPPLAGDPGFWERIRSTTFADDPRILEWLDTAIAEAGRDEAKIAAIEKKLVALVESADATPAARQAACLRLGLILGTNPDRNESPALRALAGLLADSSQQNNARLALEPVPGRAVDAAFIDALGKAGGDARLALVQSIGNRRIAASVPALTPLLSDPDAAVAGAAAKALGGIGGDEALKALRMARDQTEPAIVGAKLAIAAWLPMKSAESIYREIYDESSVADAQRAAALRGLITTRGSSGTELVERNLSGGVEAFHQVAVEAIVTLPDRKAGARLGSKLAHWSPENQVAVVHALGRRADTTAVPALRRLASEGDEALRLAAIGALGRIPGDRETARLLAGIAAGGGDAAKTAADALARLAGRGIDKLVIDGAKRGDGGIRLVFIRQLALRNLTEARPLLLSLRSAGDTDVRLAALESLGEIGTMDDQVALIEWALAASDKAEQNRAVRSLINLTLRDDSVDTRADAVVVAIDNGGNDVRIALLPVLSRVGGARALACAERSALSPDRELAAAAAVQLVRWTDKIPAVLVGVAENAGHETVRSTAAEGAVRHLDREDGTAGPDQAALIGRLLDEPGDAARRARLLYLLGRCTDESAIAIAERFLGDPSVGAEARDAADAVRANLLWPPAFTASASGSQLRNITDGHGNTRWSVPSSEGSWLQADFKSVRPVRKLTLDQGNRSGDFPSELQVYVFDDPSAPGEVRLTAKGERQKTVLTLPAGVRGRYVLLRHLGTRADGTWSVAEFRVE